MAHRDRSDHILTDWDRVFDALVNPSRRYVLEYPRDRSEPASVWNLAIALVVRTIDLPSDGVDVQVVQQAKIGIVHVRLLKLQVADFVESRGNGVSLTEHAETLLPFMSAYRGVVRPVSDEGERREP